MVARIELEDVRYFFDRATVQSALDEHERRVLSRTGAFGRQVMRNSIRKRPKRNYTPKPPFPRYRVHRNTGLRLIFFVYSPFTGSVVIGPVRFKNATKRVWHNRIEFWNYGSKTVPELLNEGGIVHVTQKYRSGNTYSRTFNYRRFPYRDEAWEKTLEFMKKVIEQEELKS